jgi:hypothetical protein
VPVIHYTIHEPAAAPADPLARADATQFVKEGIAWWALIFPLLWLLYHRMWIVLAGFVALLILIEAGSSLAGLEDAAAGWITIVVTLIFALEANDLRRWTLARAGFVTVGAVSGRDRTECELRYFSQWPDAPVSPASRGGMGKPTSAPAAKKGSGAGGEEEVIGLFPEAGR